MVDETDITEAEPSREPYIAIGVSINGNPDVRVIGLDGLGAWILIAAYVKKWGDRGHLKINGLNDLRELTMLKRCRFETLIQHWINIGWLHVSASNSAISIPKWAKYQRNPEHKLTKNLPPKNIEHRTSNKERRILVTPEAGITSDLTVLESEKFEEFYKAYPKAKHGRTVRKETVKVWNARIRDKIDPDSLILAAQNYAAEGREPRWVKGAQVFLGPNAHYEAYIEDPKRLNLKPKTKSEEIADVHQKWIERRGVLKNNGAVGGGNEPEARRVPDRGLLPHTD